MTVAGTAPPGIRVTVIVTTFNHEAYIAQALDGAVSQEGVGFEILVGDDCSEDGTRAVIDRYAARYPHLVRVHYPAANLGDGGKNLLNELIGQARGQYLAAVDGDDYFSSPDKLRRQAAHLDEHPECSMVFHQVLRHLEGAGEPDQLHHPAGHPARIGWEELLSVNPVASVAPLFRREVLDPLPAWYFGLPWGDWPTYLMAARQGEIHYLPDVMAVYRVHRRGLYSGRAAVDRRRDEVVFFERLAGVLPPEVEGLRRRRLAIALTRLAQAQLRTGDRAAARESLAESFRSWSPDPRRLRRGGGEATRILLWARTRRRG